MKTRLSVARSLLHDPPLLFWDEPTAGLDPVNGRRIKELALSLRRQGRTIFLTTHDMALAEAICDRVAFIAAGRIILIDSPRNLKLQFGEAAVRDEYRHDGGSSHRDFPLHGLAEDAGFHRLLASGRVQTIHTREASLDDIFIRVTGQALH